MFGQLAEQHLAMRREEGDANGQSKKWFIKIEVHIAQVREIVGNETAVSAVDFDEALRVRGIIAALPANRSMFYPGLSIEKAIDIAPSA